MSGFFGSRRHKIVSRYAPLYKHFSDQSWLSVPGKTLINWPPPPPPPQVQPQQLPPCSRLDPTLGFSQTDFSTICSLLRNPSVTSGPVLESALDRTGIEPDPGLVQAVFEHFDSSPKLLHTVFLWAESKPGFKSSPTLFNSAINTLAKAREFDSAWRLVLDRIGGGGGRGDQEPDFVSKDTIAILIRRYARAGII